MSTKPPPGISVRRDGENVAIEDYDVEYGKPVLTRISLMDAATAIRIGRVLVHLGSEIYLEQAARSLNAPNAISIKHQDVASLKALEFAPRSDPYPEDRK